MSKSRLSERRKVMFFPVFTSVFTHQYPVALARSIKFQPPVVPVISVLMERGLSRD